MLGRRSYGMKEDLLLPSGERGEEMGEKEIEVYHPQTTRGKESTRKKSIWNMMMMTKMKSRV